MLGRQRPAKIVPLGFEQLLRLLALRRRLRPQIFQSGRVATLAGLSGRLHLRLELLAKRLHLRLVLRVNVLDVGFLSVAERDSFEELLLHGARTEATTAEMLPRAVLRGALMRPGRRSLGRLLSRRDNSAADNEGDRRDRRTNILHGEPPPIELYRRSERLH